MTVLVAHAVTPPINPEPRDGRQTVRGFVTSEPALHPTPTPGSTAAGRPRPRYGIRPAPRVDKTATAPGSPPFTQDTRDGRPVALLPLRGEPGPAVLDLADAERLLVLGAELHTAYLSRMERGGPHVAIQTRGGHLSPYPFLLLSHFVAQPRPGRYVTHVNRDRLDLRRHNLRA